MLIVGIDIGSYFTTYAYSYEFENKTFLKSAKFLSGFNLEKVVQDDTVYIIKKLLSLERNTDPVPKNFMFLTEMLTEKDFLNEVRKYVGRIVKIIPVDQDESDDKYFIVSYPRGLLPHPLSKIYLELVCQAIIKGIRSHKQYKNSKIFFITDYEAFRQCYKELLIRKQRSEMIENAPPGSSIPLDFNNLSKKYSKSLVLMNDKDSNTLSIIDNKDYEKAYEELLEIDAIFNSLNDIDVETYKTLYIDFGLKSIRFHYSEFINIIKPIKNTIVDDITDILIEQHLSNFCYNLTSDNQKKLRAQLREDVSTIILPKFTETDCQSYQHEFKFELIHILKITREMIDLYIQSTLLCDVIERIYENANSPIRCIELCGGLSHLYYNFLKSYFPNITINISNINISVGCVYYQQNLLEKEKILRNKYRDAKLDCKTQLEKLHNKLEEEKLTFSFLNKEQLDFFHRQQEKQQLLIEKSSNSPLSDLDWVETVHKKDSKEQEMVFLNLVDKQRIIEGRIDAIKDKIKKVEEFSSGLDKYYKNINSTFGNASFDFFSSYSIVITSNEDVDNDNGITSSDSISNQNNKKEKVDVLTELNISPVTNNIQEYYFKKLGMVVDDDLHRNGKNYEKGKKIEIVGSLTDLTSPISKANHDGSPSSSNTTSPNQSDTESINGGMTFQLEIEQQQQQQKSSSKSNNDNNNNKNQKNIINNLSTSIKSSSPPSLRSNTNSISSSLATKSSNRNALAALNSKFISFNLQNDRLKKKTQLLEENHTLGNELKKVQTKNFTLSEELSKVKQENNELKEENTTIKEENEKLQKQIEELTQDRKSVV